jgi:hypothetical protein
MKRWGYWLIGGAVGLAASAIYNYLFAPAPATRLDGSYQSRWDWAMAEGDKAAAAREQELRQQFEEAKRPRPALPPTEPPPPVAPPAAAPPAA